MPAFACCGWGAQFLKPRSIRWTRGGARRPEDIRIDLSRAIQSLPEHYREVILLRDIEEMSIDEIAAVLGLTRESVKARIHRARMLIREYLVRD